MINFCTLFDSNYLARGIVLYKSLVQTKTPFHLYVFAFDDNCYQTLVKQNYPHLTVISLKEFEDDELLKVKPTRSAAEYCWTCTPSTILYCIKKYNLSSCTYLDADMYFYGDASVLLDEMGDKSVLITEHRYTKLYDQSKISGIYCVQFVCFKNTNEGMNVLHWWRNACLEWCYSYYEDGKFGDQKYLDTWPRDFNCVHVLKHEGGGVAPWNIQQYDLANENDQHFVINKKTKRKFELIFFHYHGLRFHLDHIINFSPPLYDLSTEVKREFYIPYSQELIAVTRSLTGISFDPNGAKTQAPSATKQLMTYVKNFIQYLPNDLSGLIKIKSYNFKNHIHNHKF
jgi:hypothetical protein